MHIATKMLCTVQGGGEVMEGDEVGKMNRIEECPLRTNTPSSTDESAVVECSDRFYFVSKRAGIKHHVDDVLADLDGDV